MDKRIEKTRQALTSALFGLLEDEPIEEITITKLCAKAHVSRRTFYMHYSNIFEIFEDFRDEMALKVYRALNNETSVSSDIITIFDKILMSNYQGFRQLCLNNRHHALIDDLHKMLFSTFQEVLEISDDDSPKKLALEYISFGIINSYVYWFKHPNFMSYEELNETNRKIIDTNLRLIKK